MADHPDREELAAFQAGDGDRRQRSGVEAHLAGCPSCTEVVASVERARSGLALLEEPALPSGLHDRLTAALEAEAAQAPPDLSASRGRRPAAPAAGLGGSRRRRATPGAASLPADRRDQEAAAAVLRPTPWYRRPVAWGAAAALLVAALVVPFLDQSGTMTSADRAASQLGQTESAGGSAQLPVIRIPGGVTAAKVQSSLADDDRAKAALDAAGGGAPAAAPGEGMSPDYGGQDAARSSTPAPQSSPPAGRSTSVPQADPALLAACLPAATGIADPATRPLTPAFFVEGTYKGREATILVTTSASPPGRVDLWVFPRNDCSAPPVETERVR